LPDTITIDAINPTSLANEKKNGALQTEQLTISEYIRHQIHHPENTNNTRFTSEQLQESISSMREFIDAQKT